MFVNAIKIAKNAVFPIFRAEHQGARTQWAVTGAGFFISPDGHFASVAHIFDNAAPNTQFLYLGQVPDQVQNPSLPITEIVRDDSHDIYIGKVETKPSEYFSLSQDDPQIGRSVCIAGYPLAALTNNSAGGLEVGGVRRYIQPSFILDFAQSNSSNGSGVIREHRGFLVRDVGLFGMSGGPVFDVNGLVIGMQASVTPPRLSQGAGRTISVENALAIGSRYIFDLATANNISTLKPVNRLLRRKILAAMKKLAAAKAFSRD
ncbi:hypothetical protein A3D88_01195 [Candidatus Peribacteria bacterium RIFCSPHIGHO2_02_FULL_52_16]|nr:MAG: hypothetical protein A3D88_01195 [Candidatus Peribacteria bacterium RIFCSPHIGHO2_02_FULL_52_16]